MFVFHNRCTPATPFVAVITQPFVPVPQGPDMYVICDFKGDFWIMDTVFV